MTSLRLTSVERRAIVDGTDPVSARHRFRPVLGPDGDQYADLPPEPDTVRLADWQDALLDREDEDADRTLTDDMPAGYCPRYWGGGI